MPIRHSDRKAYQVVPRRQASLIQRRGFNWFLIRTTSPHQTDGSALMKGGCGNFPFLLSKLSLDIQADIGA